LLLFGVMPFWSRLLGHPAIGSALAGANAAVVGLLAAALWNPLLTTTIGRWTDLVIIAVTLLALVRFHMPPLFVVAVCLAAAILSAQILQ